MTGFRKFGAAARRLMKDQNGASAIEYAMVSTVLGLAIAGALPFLVTKLSTMLQTISNWF